MPSVTSTSLKEIGLAAGLSAIGIAKADILEPAFSVLQKRKDQGLSGSMQFTYRNPERSTDPRRVLPSARSIIAAAYSYWQPYDEEPTAAVGRIARYARDDYYGELRKALQVVAGHLKDCGHKAVVVADTNALVDRNVAWLAGIGWYGKNANILLPDTGSWFVLGSIVTDAELEPLGTPLADGCGSCTKCIDDCPTQAIVGPGIVDASKCIAWIVQAPGVIPTEFRVAIGDRIYGCDECQEVCPPNQLIARNPTIKQEVDISKSFVDIFWLLAAEDADIEARYGAWYIADRNIDYLRRTALVVLGNVADPTDPQSKETLLRYLVHPEEILRAHAVWAVRRLGMDALLVKVKEDKSRLVQEELDSLVEVRFG